MHYYQIFYLYFLHGTTAMTGWFPYQHEKPYNPNIAKQYLQNMYSGAAVIIVEPVTEITKERYDQLIEMIATSEP